MPVQAMTVAGTLPLSADHDHPLNVTPHPDARHHDCQNSGERIAPLVAEDDHKTPPHRIMASAILPSRCGYLGPESEADVDESREVIDELERLRF